MNKSKDYKFLYQKYPEPVKIWLFKLSVYLHFTSNVHYSYCISYISEGKVLYVWTWKSLELLLNTVLLIWVYGTTKSSCF